MKSAGDLANELRRIDGRSYPAYKDLNGVYAFERFTLYIDYVQGDPFAAPSRIRLRVPQELARLPGELFSTKTRRAAAEDFVTRCVADAIETVKRAGNKGDGSGRAGRTGRGGRDYARDDGRTRGDRPGGGGSGKSGLIAIDRPGQAVLERTSVKLTDQFLEARLVVGLPAAGRRVLGREAEVLLLERLPRIVDATLLWNALDGEAMRVHVLLAEDQEWVREELGRRGLVAFVGNGSILPRQSGVSDKPMPKRKATPFVSPPTLEVELSPPHRGPIKGLGVPKGVTLIVGGGYHGKSTLLRALERGVYNHVAGDGREWCVTDSAAVKVRAEDGRRVERVDISPFINDLPFGRPTDPFSSDDASGSTSQAANILEAIEVGARSLLIDEDTSATNFMIRDVRMQTLVAKEKEPITPFVDRVRQLYDELDVSTVLVVGGSGDYLDAADTVIMMDEYRPLDVTERAQSVAAQHVTGRRREGGGSLKTKLVRRPRADSVDATKGRRAKVKVAARDLHEIRFGEGEIHLHAVEQLVDPSQTRAIGDALVYAASRLMDGRRSIVDVLDALVEEIDASGLDVLSPFGARGEHPGEYARPRRFEIAAALNRLRTLRIDTARGRGEPPRGRGA